MDDKEMMNHIHDSESKKDNGNQDLKSETNSKEEITNNQDQTITESEENNLKSKINEEKGVEEENEMERLQNEVAEWKDKFLRKMAEFENYKKRAKEEQIQLINYSNEKLIKDLLPIIDDFERTLNFSKEDVNNNPVLKGVEIVYNKLMKVLSSYGLKKIEALNQPFDFNYHEALLQIPKEDVEPLTVVEEVEKGYMFHDRVLRHSKVIVSSDVKIEDQPTNNNNEENN